MTKFFALAALALASTTVFTAPASAGDRRYDERFCQAYASADIYANRGVNRASVNDCAEYSLETRGGTQHSSANLEDNAQYVVNQRGRFGSSNANLSGDSVSGVDMKNSRLNLKNRDGHFAGYLNNATADVNVDGRSTLILNMNGGVRRR